MWSAVLLFSCSVPDTGSDTWSVGPSEARAGARVVVEHPSRDARYWLRGPHGAWPVAPAGDGLLVPDVSPGRYALVRVDAAGVSSRALRVLGAPVELPCEREYAVNTQLSIPDGVAIVDRFYADGTRERVATPLTEIERIEYVDAELDDGRHCGAILLRKTDGAALLFEDETEGDLRARARTLARYMSKDLAIVDP